MPKIFDRDGYFLGRHSSSMPRSTLGQGEISRLINGRFVEGAITNALSFDELAIESATPDTRLFTSKSTYADILERGDVQGVGSLSNSAGDFLIAGISGRLFRIDLSDCIARDITPTNACFPESSLSARISFLNNDGGLSPAGEYQVLFQWPNRPILISANEARTTQTGAEAYEVPTSRMGATSANRLFVIEGRNTLLASDPVGGQSSFAPLSFIQSRQPGADFFGQSFTIGSSLSPDNITALCRLPVYGGSAFDFVGQQLLASTAKHKYLINSGSARDVWDQTQFISYLGDSDGVAGPEACTNIGSNVVYISTSGRIKSLGQDTERDSSLQESFLDDDLGQYLCDCQPNFYHRPWYRELDHSYSSLQYNRDRLYATVYPFLSPAINALGNEVLTPSHKALAVASIDSTTTLGPTTPLSWEGFYDFIQPRAIVKVKDDIIVVSKDEKGFIKFLRLNYTRPDTHKTTVFTRGYFNQQPSKSKSILKGGAYFRTLDGPATLNISYLANNKWICGTSCPADKGQKLYEFAFQANNCRTNSDSIALKIEIEHNGCRFELAGINVEGETHGDS